MSHPYSRIGPWGNHTPLGFGFTSWKCFDVSVNEEEIFHGKISKDEERVWYSMGL